MKKKPLLTIAIPTYNRGDRLNLLLEALSCENFGDQIEVIIADNASEDNTADVIGRYLESNPKWIAYRHAENLGMDGNFLSCYLKATGEYLWLLGDDDRIVSGGIRAVLNLIELENPDLIYTASAWTANIWGHKGANVPQTLPYIIMDADDFAVSVNVWFTFISGNIARISQKYLSEPWWRQFDGSKLIQLGWILPVLITGRKFAYISKPLIVAQAENSGGYKVFEVFGENLFQIATKLLPEKLASHILKYTCAVHVPALIWNKTSGKQDKFLKEDILQSLACYRKYAAYWLIVFPMLLMPGRVAGFPFAAASRGAKYLWLFRGLIFSSKNSKSR
ncbi:MAG: glycosyltransferase family 2 protein [Nevskiaceae bacterium]|nr:MAG: glycosyltransferase family 2 protein [Nevskiaceae bacterium]